MATSTSVSTTYAGEKAGGYIKVALLSSPTLDKGLITIKPNIKYKEVVKKMTADGLFQDRSCDFNSTGSVTITERILEPKELQVNQQVCKAPFRQDWEATQMGFSAHDNLPPTFSEFIVAHYVAATAQNNEINIWRGTDVDGGYNGFATLLAADAALPTANEVAGTTVDATNVIAELTKITNAIPNTIYGSPDMVVYVSQNIYRAYVTALGGFGANGLGANGVNGQGTQWYAMGSGLMINGVRLEMVNGLAANTAIAAESTNLWFGTGLLNDHNDVRVIDMADIDGSDNVRFVMKFTAGVQYGNVTEIVTYGITNNAN